MKQLLPAIALILCGGVIILLLVKNQCSLQPHKDSRINEVRKKGGDIDLLSIISKNQSEFVITAKNQKTGLLELDFSKHKDRALIKQLLDAILKLSRTHDNADFKIIMKNQPTATGASHLVAAVTLFKESTDPLIKNCPFCTTAGRRGATIAETHTVVAFEKSTPPKHPINFLIIPKEHIVNYKDNRFTADLFIELLLMAQHLAQKLTDPADVLLHINNGTNADQTVFHSHMHFLSPAAKWL